MLSLALLLLLETTEALATRGAVAQIDLMTSEGVRLVNATWRYSDVRVITTLTTDAAGNQVTTNDYEPHAGAADFDDTTWEVIEAPSLAAPRSKGRMSFNWYRLRVTVPSSVDGHDVTGKALFFETVVDDYAEVWVDGRLPRDFGQSGGSVVAGFNAPNRVLLTRNAIPGQRIQIALFGINGPISDTPQNFIFLRSAKLEFVDVPRQRTVRR